MNIPFFSIIIPTYNSEKTIHSCLQSILSQSYSNLEVLIIDGLSTDKTISIAKSLGDSRIKIYTEKDIGPFDGMNKGIQLAKGEWLYFLGSDDILADNEVLSDVVKIGAGEDLIYGDVILQNNSLKYGGFFDIQRLTTKGNICHQSIFYKRSVFKTIGNYNLNYKIWADWDLNIRCFKHPGIKNRYINRTIAVYNNSSGMSTGKFDEVFFKELPVKYILQMQQMEKDHEDKINKITGSRSFIISDKISRSMQRIRRLLS